ncbi:hypothetical protein Gmet_1485 [Geobacter metallireducens GS-15]|uniref:Uncharacterized protein n=1 Tax=Geobacter metallireducens (strain ATCC 53774 / DSM 7210 / GS-15) TaxID=269799 RepID=Q39VK5_GEOMG|nr:hypothetical protein Gmet_1485 [Geobacter metallireducens GS-15]
MNVLCSRPVAGAYAALAFVQFSDPMHQFQLALRKGGAVPFQIEPVHHPFALVIGYSGRGPRFQFFPFILPSDESYEIAFD